MGITAGEAGVAGLIVVALPESRVAVDSTPRTAEGIGLGSTRAEVEATYPEATPVSDQISTYFVVPLSGTQLVIDLTPEDVVQKIQVGGADRPVREYCG